MLSSQDPTAATSAPSARLAQGMGDMGDVALSPSLRQSLTEAPHPLSARRAHRDVMLDDIERVAGVAAEELASVYACRDEAAPDFLARQAGDWSIRTTGNGARKTRTNPEERLLAIFDVFDDWFHRDDFDACSIIDGITGIRVSHPLGPAPIESLAHIRQIVMILAKEANLREPEEFSRCLEVLMKGSIISAAEGDANAAKRSQNMARVLIRVHRGIARAALHLTEENGPSVEWTDWDDPMTEQKVLGIVSTVEGQEDGFDSGFECDLD